MRLRLLLTIRFGEFWAECGAAVRQIMEVSGRCGHLLHPQSPAVAWAGPDIGHRRPTVQTAFCCPRPRSEARSQALPDNTSWLRKVAETSLQRQLEFNVLGRPELQNVFGPSRYILRCGVREPMVGSVGSLILMQ